MKLMIGARKKTVPVPIDAVVRVYGNEGGYKSAECIICDQGGWLDGKYGYAWGTRDVGAHLKHKKNCPMNKYALTKRRQS